MKLFKVSSDIMPTIYYKAKDQEEVLIQFAKGFDYKTFRNHVDDPTFKIEELSLESFVEELPEEFMIDVDTSF